MLLRFDRQATALLMSAFLASACDFDERIGSTAGTSGPVAPAAAVLVTPAVSLKAPFAHENGFAFTMHIDQPPTVRKYHVFEDGRELGPADSLHDDIRKIGMGRYSDWTDGKSGATIYFSASDNSDPNTNGRSYELR
ncbi:MAG TPA: hypothetical protein VG942_05525 [Hyphomonadaceae bacterium]|nr:hypothetical protein [Hyphomonadaceae bacterium]